MSQPTDVRIPSSARGSSQASRDSSRRSRRANPPKTLLDHHELDARTAADRAARKRGVYTDASKYGDYVPPGQALKFNRFPLAPESTHGESGGRSHAPGPGEPTLTEPSKSGLLALSQSIISSTEVSLSSSANHADQLRGGNPIDDRARRSSTHRFDSKLVSSEQSSSKDHSTSADKTVMLTTSHLDPTNARREDQRRYNGSKNLPSTVGEGKRYARPQGMEASSVQSGGSMEGTREGSRGSSRCHTRQGQSSHRTGIERSLEPQSMGQRSLLDEGRSSTFETAASDSAPTPSSRSRTG